MKRLLRNPAVNGTCLGLFSAFYAAIFLLTSGHMEFGSLLYYARFDHHNEPFWTAWSRFLAAGHHAWIAWALLSLTAAVIALLFLHGRSYDEYHTALLTNCLAVSLILTLAAIAVFYFMVLSESNGIVEKFTLFIVIHWATVVLADLVFVLACRWR